MFGTDEGTREALRSRVRPLLDSHRDMVAVDGFTIYGKQPATTIAVVTPIWAIQLVDDWASDTELNLTLEEFLSGMLFGVPWGGDDVVSMLSRAPKINPKGFTL